MARNRIQPGVRKEDVTIWGAIDWLKRRRCWTRQRGECCSHRGCDMVDDVVDALERMACDRSPGMSLTEMLFCVSSKRNRGAAAESKSALQNLPYIEWLEEFLVAAIRGVAA